MSCPRIWEGLHFLPPAAVSARGLPLCLCRWSVVKGFIQFIKHLAMPYFEAALAQWLALSPPGPVVIGMADLI